ncbi:MAG TPA: vWA domain-containing protein [Baekduia sp.]|nr:vWA domain-containing protein [Baekduia sp.]
MSSKKLGLAAVTALGAAAFAALPTGGAVAASTCVPATKVQAIIDDSGSMAITDQNNLRAAGIKLLINKPGNSKLILGASEFGSSAGSVFAPVAIGGAASAMAQALDAKILADNGSTDYNLAFAQGKADNPGADARIFLTDGEHNVGTYNNGHQGGPKTYVVGFGTSITDPINLARLQQIAAETGGTYTAVADASGLQSTINSIDATLGCKSISETFSDQFNTQGQTVKHSVKIKSTVSTADFVISWSNPADKFDITGVTQSSGKASVAKKKKVKIKKTVGATFITVRVSNLKKGKLKFKVKNTTLTAPTVVTTQVTKNVKKKSKKKKN